MVVVVVKYWFEMVVTAVAAIGAGGDTGMTGDGAAVGGSAVTSTVSVGVSQGCPKSAVVSHQRLLQKPVAASASWAGAMRVARSLMVSSRVRVLWYARSVREAMAWYAVAGVIERAVERRVRA